MPSVQYCKQCDDWILEEISKKLDELHVSHLWKIFDSSLKGLSVRFFCRSPNHASLCGWFLTLCITLLISRVPPSDLARLQHVEYLGFWSHSQVSTFHRRPQVSVCCFHAHSSLRIELVKYPTDNFFVVTKKLSDTKSLQIWYSPLLKDSRQIQGHER